jgi:(2R)-3-sulfolactate dehydrogenase (NADP+)
MASRAGWIRLVSTRYGDAEIKLQVCPQFFKVASTSGPRTIPLNTNGQIDEQAYRQVQMSRHSLDEIFDLCQAALAGCGASTENAASVAASVREAEAEGITNVGLGFTPYYCEHLLQGNIDGRVRPRVFDGGPAVVNVDAGDGFAHPAFDAGEASLVCKARECGLAALSIRNVYYNGVEGYFARRLALRGLVGFACTVAAAMAAPYGGNKPVFGTNPLAFGVPRAGQPPLVLDLSTTTTAFVNVAAAANRGESIPTTWALDALGHPTTDPNEGLNGSLQPLGGAKGTALALMVEILAGGLAGANWSFEVPPFGERKNAPPRLGQFYMAIDPAKFANPDLPARLESLIGEMLEQDGVRLPGARRDDARAQAQTDGVEVDDTLIASLKGYATR